MRLVTIILIWISLCLQCFVQLGFVKWYEWNKIAITNRYCINKDRPQLRCNGKCHLKKQLQKLNDEQSKEKSNNAQQIDWVAFVVPERFSMPSVLFTCTQKNIPFYGGHYKYVPLYSVFHPPTVV